MSIENKGWFGGDGSMADAMFDRLWSGRDLGSSGQITDGPLAEFVPGYDPLAQMREKQAQHKQELNEKTARVLGNDNNFESSTEPGGNRTVQQNSGAGRDTEIQQTKGDAGGTGESGDTKKDKAPSSGSRGSEVMKRLKAKRAAEGAGAETTTQGVGPQGASRAAGHNLNKRDLAPTPKELDPARRVGNLADYDQKSAWTGSGPQAALHDDYSKVGEVDPEIVNSLLAMAGVPQRELDDDSWLMKKAEAAAVMVKQASSSDYLARPDVHPLKLVAELSDTLGEDWTEWEPETIRDTIEKEAGLEPSDEVMNKVMAVKIVLARPDRFFDDWHAFEKISVALNDSSPTMNSIEDVPVEWLSNAVTIVEKLAAEGDFGPEVQKYTAARLFDQGYVVAPPKLAFADSHLSGMVNDDGLRKKVILAYSQALNENDVMQRREDPITVQVARLMRNHGYVLDKLDEGQSQLS